MMQGDRVATLSTGGQTLESVRDTSVRTAPDVSALATRGPRSASVLVWNYHDDDLGGAPADVTVTLQGLPNGRATLTQYRIDEQHSNSYARWKAMGSPQSPTTAQYAELEAAGKLQTIGPASPITVTGGSAKTTLMLPRQGVSLVKVDW
jgi:xylan 1,4-beta-xylosidase